MPPFISTFLQAWAERRTARRRRANLRAGARRGSAHPGRPALTLIRSDADTAPIGRKAGSRREKRGSSQSHGALTGLCLK